MIATAEKGTPDFGNNNQGMKRKRRKSWSPVAVKLVVVSGAFIRLVLTCSFTNALFQACFHASPYRDMVVSLHRGTPI